MHFQDVYKRQDVQHPEAKFDRAAHHALAAELEKECAVLLQNKGALPLARAAKIASVSYTHLDVYKRQLLYCVFDGLQLF